MRRRYPAELQGTGIATPSSRRALHGVEVDAAERDVKVDFHRLDRHWPPVPKKRTKSTRPRGIHGDINKLGHANKIAKGGRVARRPSSKQSNKLNCSVV